MRVLVISQTYCEWNARAKWRHIYSNHKDLIIKIITPKEWPDTLSKVVSKEEGIGSRYSLKTLNAYFLGHEIYHIYPSIHKLIKEFNPDIVQVETGSNSLVLFQVLMTKKLYSLKTKVIFFSWINWIHKFGWKYRYFYQWIEKFNLRNVDGAVLGNQDSLKLFRANKKFLKPAVVLPQLGTDPDIFHSNNDIKKKFRKSHGIGENDFVIGFAGRLVEEKGVIVLLEAFNKFLSRLDNFENIKLVIVGQGNYERNIKDLIKELSLSDKVVMLGAKKHNEMPDFFKSLDLFVLPSFDRPTWKEQFGQVLVQAMLTKVATIGSDAGEIPNVIKDCGIVFHQGDSDELSDHLIDLFNDPKLRYKYASLGYNRALSEFSNFNIGNKTYDFWCDVVNH